MRCFIAIKIPDKIKSEIDTYLAKLQKSNSDQDIKWVNINNMHLTLQFIGEISANKIGELSKALENIKSNYFQISFKKNISFFPNNFNPKIIKISLNDREENLQRLNSMIRQQLNKLGIKYDKKPFSAHLTLGRIKYLNSKFKTINLIRLSELKVEKFYLFCSELTSNGPIYTQLATINL